MEVVFFFPKTQGSKTSCKPTVIQLITLESKTLLRNLFTLFWDFGLKEADAFKELDPSANLYWLQSDLGQLQRTDN